MALTCIKWFRRVSCGASIAFAIAATPAHGATDADVLAAKEALQKGNWKALDALRPRFAGDILEAYPTYWLLSGTLDRADPAQVRAFLDKYPASPLAESLRREWLRALGAAGSWEIFRAEFPKVSGEDVEISCYALQERQLRNDGEVTGEARALFVSARETPSACDPLFASLVATGAVTEAQVWQRVRKLLAINAVKDVKRTLALMPRRQAIPDKLLDRIQADPMHFLAHEKAAVLTRSQSELVLYALERLARSREDDAADRLEAFAARLGDDAPYAWAQVAWQAALNHNPRALEWYAKAADAPLTDSQVEWKARAAMRAGQWKAVLAAIQALPPEVAREPSWRYWRARSLRELGEKEACDGLLRSLAGQPTFYGLLASEELGQPYVPEWNGFHPQQADLERVRAVAGVQRALALYRAGLDNEGVREWLWAIRGFDDRDLLAAAEVARLANVADRAINTANRTVQLHDFAQRYPMPHREALASASRQWAMDEAIVYAIIRQESRFMPDARSRAGAAGLMQLMPATARWVARQMPMHPFHVDMLLNPEVNIAMGTYYFRRVLDALAHPILATAAYNAGPTRARRWRDDKPLEGAIYAETIPFNETREYVKQVFTNAYFYTNRLTGKPANLHQLLGTVPGRESDTSSFAANIP
ncbi:MAG TPA: transglycosylase SLT domain-containing protein [Usitatibacter sp.]|jgi:soluble lytic murein transglycosylase|nr:transglycosylase SLT domain-containing protein [Usitatibacter sp.]